MRVVSARGGPSASFQSEVEQEKKSEVHPDVLARWIEVLRITEEFARGEIPTYHMHPDRCRGLAADVVPLVEANRQHLSTLETNDRVSEVIRTIVRCSGRLPRVVLAYVLSIDVSVLEDMIAGMYPLLPVHIKAVACITTIPEVFLLKGKGQVIGAPLEEFLPAIDLARSRGLSGKDLLLLVQAFEAADGQELSASVFSDSFCR